MFLADTLGLDGVVILIDRESKRAPDRAQRLRDGRRRYRNAAGDSKVACAVGAACRSVETWLLADPVARREVFGATAPDPFSGDPEDRPPPRILKQYIGDRALGAHMDLKDAHEGLARAARPSQLRRACVTSYPPFADDVAAEITPLC